MLFEIQEVLKKTEAFASITASAGIPVFCAEKSPVQLQGKISLGLLAVSNPEPYKRNWQMHFPTSIKAVQTTSVCQHRHVSIAKKNTEGA